MKRKHLKQWLFATALILMGFGIANAQVTEGTEYLLHLDGSDYYLSAETSKAGSSSELSMQGAGEPGYDQTVVFTKTSEGYNIAIGQDFTIVRDSWYMRYKNTADVNLGSKDAIFSVEISGNGIKLKNLGTGKYVGCDKRGVGEKFYSDKTGGNVCEFVLESLDVEFYKDRLTSKISEANNLLASTEEGDGPGQYPAEARTKLAAAIAVAENALNSEIDILKDAIKSLSDAINVYVSLKNPMEYATGFYRFAYKGIDGTYLSNGWQANSWEPDNVMSTGIILNENESGYNQQFMVSRTASDADANGYNIRDKDGYYLFNSNGNLLYDEANSIDPNSSDAIFLFEEDGSYVRIVNVATGKYVGPVDNTTGWTWIHLGTNYNGPADGCRYTMEYLGADVAGMLQEVINEAVALLASTEEGTLPGQYPTAARKDLSDKIAEAQKILSEGSEEEMIAIMNSLKLEISYYKDRVVAPYFKEGVYKFYHEALPGAVLASGWHANSWESWNVEHTTLILNESEAGEYNVEFTVRKSPETAEFSGYNIIDNENNPLINSDGKLLVDEKTSLDDTNALFIFEEVNGGIHIRSLGTRKNVGPVDNTKGWSWIHAGTAHTGTDNGDLFRSVLVRDIETGVEDVDMDNKFSVRVNGDKVRLEGAAYANVYDVSGVKVKEIKENNEISLESGVYVVLVNTGKNTKSVKVLIK